MISHHDIERSLIAACAYPPALWNHCLLRVIRNEAGVALERLGGCVRYGGD